MSRHALVVGAFAASLLAVLLTPFCTRDRVGDVAVWVDAVSGSLQPGEAVLVHPPWRDDVARALRERGVSATVAVSPRHGDALPPLVVVTDGTAPLPRVIAAALSSSSGPTFEKGGVTVARIEGRAVAAGARSLLDGLRDARVELRMADGAVVGCPWDALAQRHVCEGQPEWQHVGVTEQPVGGQKVRCAWAHPKTGAVLSVRFPHAPLLEQLDLSLALSDGAVDNPRGAPVRAALFVNGAEAGAVTKKAGERGFAKTTARVSPGDADVELRITTDDDGQRHTCFLLETRGGS